MKKTLSILSAFVFILFLSILYINERTDRIKAEEEMHHWRSIAKTEQRIPSINQKAEEFVKDLNKGKHVKYLTGIALKEYENAMKEGFAVDEGDHESLGLQEISVLLSNTKSVSQDEANSTILYQLDYEGIFNSEETGVVDRRIMTLLMNVNWINTKEGFLVNSYSVTALEDTMGIDLPLNIEGSAGQ